MPASCKFTALMLAVIFLLTGCVPANPPDNPGELIRYTKDFWEFMDTNTAITIFTAKTAAEVEVIWRDTARELGRLHGILSSFEADSDVTKINAKAGLEPVPVEPETLAVVEKALAFATLTQGAFDITLASVLRLYNFSPENPKKPLEAELLAALQLVDFRRVKVDAEASSVFLLDQGMALDLGGIAKGFVVDYIHDYLRAKGIEHVVVNAGGDIKFSGPKPDGLLWRTGIQEPDGPRNTFFAIVNLGKGAIVSSGDYQRFFLEKGKRYHHIVDPATGLPTEGMRSVTIIGPEAEVADILSTAVFILGVEKGLELINSLPEYEAILFDSSAQLHLSHGLESELARNSKGEVVERINGSPVLSIKVKGR